MLKRQPRILEDKEAILNIGKINSNYMLRNIVVDRLKKEGIPINISLPPVEKGKLRSSKQVAERVNVLGVFLAISNDQKSIPFFRNLLENQGMYNSISPNEKITLERGQLTKQEEINYSWYQESLYALSWCLNLIENMSYPTLEANLSSVFKLLPPEVELTDFLDNSALRECQKIIDETEYYYGLHWAKRHPESWSIFSRLKFSKYKLSVIRERRKALEWVIDDVLDWDAITLDT